MTGANGREDVTDEELGPDEVKPDEANPEEVSPDEESPDGVRVDDGDAGEARAGDPVAQGTGAGGPDEGGDAEGGDAEPDDAEPDEESTGDEDPDEPDEREVPSVDVSLVEALLFAADEPLTVQRLRTLLGRPDPVEVRAAVESIGAGLEERGAGFELVAVAGGYQLRTRPEHGPWIRKLRAGKPPRLSRSALETLAIVAYRPAITRAEIEAIRRVDCDGVLKTLVDRRLIKIAGRREVPGRPAIYDTTKEFLEVFGLKSRRDLPELEDIRQIADELGEAAQATAEAGTGADDPPATDAEGSYGGPGQGPDDDPGEHGIDDDIDEGIDDDIGDDIGDDTDDDIDDDIDDGADDPDDGAG